MAKKTADQQTVKLIYKLAGAPQEVQYTQSAYWGMVSHELTKCDICDAIREWIEAGECLLIISAHGRL